ncbi:Dbl homology domain-containing protein [Mycena maculata]|uniref:Dbl homology domain-containing protein n=1 Tax=Mycena maculata TaxID=230809 RepID=A0AAD7JGC8_9AGAR|nr:Dbl homology domain-containing protein [Mycena maculata]
MSLSPADAFEASPHSRNLDNRPLTDARSENHRKMIIKEIVETERNYVKNLETMHKYVTALTQNNLVDQATIHLLFANVDKVFAFQRKFLDGIEVIAELAWQDQRWGLHFIQAEEEFGVYEAYCANYHSASKLVVDDDLQHKLAVLNHLLDAKELPMCVKRPIGRVCKYPLLIESLLKNTSATDYQHYDELKSGSEAMKRVVDRINEAHRHAENEQTVKALQTCVDDWKGHQPETFGKLLRDDILRVTKSHIDRKYHIFLFENIILCCWQVIRPPPNARSDSRNIPLLLKGQILVRDVTQAVLGPPDPPAATPLGRYPIDIWWNGDNGPESFTLHCRNEEQMRDWESQLRRLIGKTRPGEQSDDTTDRKSVLDVYEDDGRPDQSSHAPPIDTPPTLPAPLQTEVPNPANAPDALVKVKVHVQDDTGPADDRAQRTGREDRAEAPPLPLAG